MRFFTAFITSAMFLFPHLGLAQDQFDVVRVKVPYSISLGTSDYEYVKLVVNPVINQRTLGGVSHLVKLSKNGTASGVAVTEFKRTSKTKADNDFKDLLKQVGDGEGKIVIQELFKEDFDYTESAKRLDIKFGLIQAKSASGEWHRITGSAPDVRIEFENKEMLKLASSSQKSGEASYGFDENEAFYGLGGQPETVGIVFENPAQQSTAAGALGAKLGSEN